MSVVALRWAYSRKITSPVSKNVLVFLASHNFGSDKLFFKVKTIASATAYSERAVQLALKDLIKNKYIFKADRFGDDGSQLTNIYKINISDEYIEKCFVEYDEPQEGASDSPPPELSAPPPRTTCTPVNSNINNNNNNNNNIYTLSDKKKYTKKEIDESFDYFWSHYPNRQGKLKAREIWEKKKLYEHVKEICQDVVDRNEFHGQWQDIKFIPHGDKYLRQRIWQDDIIPLEEKNTNKLN